ncbi:alpha/beta fold hydrolase, partial [Trinickia soli]|uniref:alpha/beta fold hydrolase n=1 Tax=Trinickia soli TaxID=380675 RepID=UPI003FA3C914
TLPLNASGKVDRRALPAPIALQTEQDVDATPFEQTLLNVIAGTLGVDGLTPGTSLIEHGLDSLTAVRVADELSRHLGIKAPLLDVYRADSVRELAATLSANATGVSEPGLSRMLSHRGGDGPPLVLIHAASGSCRPYGQLERALSSRYSVFCFESPALHGVGPMPAELRELARVYNSEMRRRFGGRSVTLAGWSLGGLLALEMASLAQRDDAYSVSHLALIDATVPSSVVPPQWRSMREPLDAQSVLRVFLSDLAATDAGLLVPARARAWTDSAESTNGARGMPTRFADAVAAGVFADDAPLEWLERVYETYAAHAQMAERHVPGPFAGAATVYIANAGTPSGAAAAAIWHDVLGAHQTVRPLAGTHYAMLDTVAVATIAAELGALAEPLAQVADGAAAATAIAVERR